MLSSVGPQIFLFITRSLNSTSFELGRPVIFLVFCAFPAMSSIFLNIQSCALFGKVENHRDLVETHRDFRGSLLALKPFSSP